MNNASLLIDIRRLNKKFGQQTVLKTIDFQLYQGDFIAIEGASGSGKSTLLSVLGLLDMDWEGDYQLGQLQIKEFKPNQLAALRNRHIGWIFQNFNLIGELNVVENVMLPLRYGHFGNKTQQRQKAQAALAQVGLADKELSFPHMLSGGQQQRVAIARALVTSPTVLFADEPTGNLDSQNAASIFTLLKQLNQDGMSSVMVTHDTELAARCPIRIKMQDGLITHTTSRERC